MAVVLDLSQRDAVFRFVVSDLPDVADIARELEGGNMAVAQRLCHHFDENVRLLDALEWGQGEDEHYQLPMPESEVKTVFMRLQAWIMADIEERLSLLSQHSLEPALAAAKTCEAVLRCLDYDESSDPDIRFAADDQMS